MGMPQPDPALRTAAAGVDEGFVTCHQHNGLVDDRWDKNFEWSHDMQHILDKNFGTKTFRANQRQAINASIAGKDVFVLMPTGGGKSFDCHTDDVVGAPNYDATESIRCSAQQLHSA